MADWPDHDRLDQDRPDQSGQERIELLEARIAKQRRIEERQLVIEELETVARLEQPIVVECDPDHWLTRTLAAAPAEPTSA